MAFQATDRTYYGTRTFHENPDKPGEYVIQKTFDRDPIIESCTAIRNEIDQRGSTLKLEARIPVTMFFEWLRTGKIAPDECMDMPNGGIAIDPKKLKALKREFSKLSCT